MERGNLFKQAPGKLRNKEIKGNGILRYKDHESEWSAHGTLQIGL